MKVLFMGTPEFSEISLKRLVESSHEVVGVVTQPDRPKGRGLKLCSSPVKCLAEKHNLMIFQPDKLPNSDLMDFLKQNKPDSIIVVAFGLKIPSIILKHPPFGCINLHGSLLPKYRGASPIQWPLINGDRITGTTTMLMDEGWDTGDMLLKSEVIINDEDNFQTLHDKLAITGADLLVNTLTKLENSEITPIKQDNSKATIARKLKDDDLILDWSNTTRELFNRIRALNPLPGARTSLDKEIIKIWSSYPSSEWYNLEKSFPGTIGECLKEKGGIPVRTGDGVLIITELQAPGRKRLFTNQYLAGCPISPGAIFS